MITKQLLDYLFDVTDNGLIRKISKGNSKAGSRPGNIDKNGYRRIEINRKLYLEHRLVFFYHNSYWPDLIDHIDRDTSNCHIDNLRDATRQQNKFNSEINSNNTSGYKGVSFDKEANKWKAYIKIDGKNINLGRYQIIEDAVASRQLAETKLIK